MRETDILKVKLFPTQKYTIYTVLYSYIYHVYSVDSSSIKNTHFEGFMGISEPQHIPTFQQNTNIL